jgi:quaternary ammonium compound-resistance protein SugE
MAWALVILAGLFETGFALSLKASSGFTRPVPTVLFVVCAAASFTLLATALRSLPVGSAYAVWTGIGAAGTAAAGMVFLGESTEVLKLVSIVLIVAGVVGLQLTSTGH